MDCDGSEMTAEEVAAAWRLMERIGGGFASTLAQAFRKADLSNQARIKAAFPELQRDYVRMVRIGHGG